TTKEQSGALAVPASFHKVSVQSVDSGRMQRAQQITKPQTIQRFNQPQLSQSQFLPVTPEPSSAIPVASTQNAFIPQATARPVATKESKAHNIFEQALANSTSHQETFDGPVPSLKSRRRQHVGFA